MTDTHSSCLVCRSLTPSHGVGCFHRRVRLMAAAVSLVSLSLQPLIGNSQQQCRLLFPLCVYADWCTVLTGGCQQLRVQQVKRLITQHSGPSRPRHSRCSQWRSRRPLIKGGLAALRSGVCGGSSSGGKQTSRCLSFWSDLAGWCSPLLSQPSSFITRRILILQMSSLRY